MKLWVKILIGAVVLTLVVILYRKFLYFPHAQVINVVPGQSVTWTNKSDVIESTITAGSNTGGTYSGGYTYQVTSLPNKQFRFVVEKNGSPVVDNIISMEHPPMYLTK